jgi:hypothetical protein
VFGLETYSDLYVPRMFENRVLRKIFGPMRDEVTRMEEVAQ